MQFDHQEAIKQPIGCIKRPPTLQMISKFVNIYFQKNPLTISESNEKLDYRAKILSFTALYLLKNLFKILQGR